MRTSESLGAASELASRRAAIEVAEEQAQARQHPRGKLSARERIAQLTDPGSFTEIGALIRHRSQGFGIERNRPDGDGVVTGFATIDGRQVCVYAQDFSIFGGSLGEAHGRKIAALMDHALKAGVPVVGVLDGGGARIQEGVASLAQFAAIFRRNVAASGVVPQISVILGPSAGGAVYSPALTDFVIMAEGTSHMFITGPDVIKTVTGEDVGFEELGGAAAHNTKSGVAHYLAADDADALEFARTLLSFLPSNNLAEPPAYAPGELAAEAPELSAIVPADDAQPYDMRDVIATCLDDGAFTEIQERFAPNVVIGFGRVEGRSVGVVANQPLAMAGTLDIAAAEKAARFVRCCDAYGIPILTFVDVPGFLPGTDQEWQGIIRRGAKLIYAYAEASVPLITVITRKAFGGAYIVMGSKELGSDVNLAWPGAQIAVMGAAGAVEIVHRRALKSADDVEAERARLTGEYREAVMNPFQAAELGYVDDVIDPATTPGRIAASLRALQDKRVAPVTRKHGNIPL